MSCPGECFICGESLTNGRQILTVKQKGINTLISKSKQKGDNNWKFLENLTEVQIHDPCRVKYYAASKSKNVQLPTPSTSNEQQLINFKTHCFLCAKLYTSTRTPGRLVSSENLQVQIQSAIDLRQDEWSRCVQLRIESINLLEVQARYHKSCYNKFTYVPRSQPLGRPKIADLEAAFEGVCQYMEESDDCQFSLSELMDKLEGWETTPQTLKQKLLNRYKQDILMMEKPGKPTIVCFRNTGYTVLSENWYQNRATTPEEERSRVIRAAGDIIREDIKSQVYDTSVYPAPEELFCNVESDVPDTLRLFLDTLLLKGKKQTDEKIMTKRDSIAHSIISVIRPRSFISSIQLATGVYLTRKFGSRLIIDILYNLGVCTSYTNISLYEASAIMACDKKISDDAFIQHVFDNADHNVCSLDGYNTFHNMGGICCITPGTEISHQGEIKKLTRLPKAEELASKSSTPVVHCDRFNGNQLGLKSVTFSEVSQLDLGDRPLLPVAYSLHILAKSWNIEHVPSWRGYMEKITDDLPYSVSQVVCVPFINLPPSDVNTINTALHSAARECLRHNQKTSFVTFDQPLYIKAREIVANDVMLNDVIVRLGGFHLLMSYLACIGTIMDGSGLKELLGTVYAGNSVEHMLTGHAFSRAIRGHLIVYAALGTMIARHANVDNSDHQYVLDLLKNFSSNAPSLQRINEDERLIKITANMLETMVGLGSASRTSKLWLQYFHCITIAMQFIEAERLGNWQLHLQCIQDMLPIFHAAGHLAYAKSAQIYLQDMAKLPDIMDPREYEKFTTEGYFTIRRSDKKWAGIWTDMTVEQTLMRVMKVTGGITHGRGVNKEAVTARWILGMPVAYEVMESFETFCGVRASTSEQHTDWRPSSMKRDAEDYLKFMEWLTVHDPFGTADSNKLMSVADGLCAGDAVNCEQAFEVGLESMKTMVGVSAADVKLKRTARVKSIATTKRGIMVNDEIITVNTTLLFQRITAAVKDDSSLATESLVHELAPFPLSLFDEQGIMRKSKKAELYNALKSQSVNEIDLTQCKIIVDGGFLLHKVVWPLGSTYDQILKLYEDYVLRNYGTNAIVVFDGYKETEMSIKSYERFRRSRTNVGTEVVFEKNMTLTLSQSKFLANDKNKDRLIDFIKVQLNSAGVAVEQAAEDADRLIVTTAIEQLDSHEKVVVVGQDVDLLVLLIALTPVEKEIHFIKKGSGRVSDALFSTQQHLHLKNSILFSHAFTGCDTTSSIYQRGKKTFLNILKKKNNLQNDVSVFNNPNSTKSSIKKAGERLMIALYGADEDKTTLNSLRYQRFASSAARHKTEVRLAQLPPTVGATEEHLWRVYFQVQKWLGNDELKPNEWGWELKDCVLFPVMTKIPPAPEKILKMIFCTCKGNCSTRCGCRRADLKCSSACSGCHGTACSNEPAIDFSSDISECSTDSTDVFLKKFDSLLNNDIDDSLDDEPNEQFSEIFQGDNLPTAEDVSDSDESTGPTVVKRQRLDL